jgi:hypothetical protein
MTLLRQGTTSFRRPEGLRSILVYFPGRVQGAYVWSLCA